MVNEVAQWTILLIVALLMLGVLRQVGLMLPPSARALPSGPAPGRRAPRALLRSLHDVLGADGLARGVTVAFVTENCVGCQRLLADLTRDAAFDRDGPPLVLVAYRPTEPFASALKETRIATIASDEELWRECGVTSTPLVIGIDKHSRVQTKEVTHRVAPALVVR